MQTLPLPHLLRRDLVSVIALLTGRSDPGPDDPKTLSKIIENALPAEKIQRAGSEGEELIYAPNNQSPYTGWAKRMHSNERLKSLNQYKDGKHDGVTFGWHENGQKLTEMHYKDGKQHGHSTTWHANGQTEWEAHYKDGKQDGLATAWYENGQKEWEIRYKDGEPQ